MMVFCSDAAPTRLLTTPPGEIPCMSAGCPRAEDGTAQQRMHCRSRGSIGRVLFLCKRKTYYTSAESYVSYTNGCCASHDCRTRVRAWTFDVRVYPQRRL